MPPPEVGYLPEERGLYPAMHARDAIAFMGALRGLPLREGRRRADELLDEHGLGDWAKKPIRTLSKGMAQTVQLLGTIIHKPRLIVLDEPFSGLDAINQARLEELIRREARDGVTIIFSTHVIAHAERLCERIAIIAKGKVAFEGRVDEARGRLRPIVRLRTRAEDGPWRSAIPASARRKGGEWVFELPRGRPRTAAQGADRRRRGDRDAGDRAARPARRVRRHRRRSGGGGDGPTGAGRNERFIRSALVIARRDFTATVLSQDLPVLPARPAVPAAVRRRVRRHRRAASPARPRSRWSRSSATPSRIRARCRRRATGSADAIDDAVGRPAAPFRARSPIVAAQQKRLLASQQSAGPGRADGGARPAAPDRRGQSGRHDRSPAAADLDRRRPARRERRRPRARGDRDRRHPSGSLATDRALTGASGRPCCSS